MRLFAESTLLENVARIFVAVSADSWHPADSQLSDGQISTGFHDEAAGPALLEIYSVRLVPDNSYVTD